MRSLRRLVMALLPTVAACNSIVGFGSLQKVTEEQEDDDGGPGPGRNDSGKGGQDGAKSDGPTPGAKCDLSKPFSPPVALSGPVNSASFELAPSLMTNELVMIFQRTVGPEGGSLMLATRTSTDAEFGEPKELTALAQDLDGIQQPTMTSDGLLLFFAGVSRTSSNVFSASRATPSGDFTNRHSVDEVNTSASESFPGLTHDGVELWFSSQADVDAPRRLMRSRRDNLGVYGSASAVGELASTKSEAGVAFSADGLTIYFGSERDGGKGDSDIWTAKRSSLDAPFGPATPVAELNTVGAEYPGWLSADGCRLYFGSDRSGNGDIFVATRTP